MKKFLKVALIVFILLVILIGGFIGFLFLQREYEISKLPPYYRELAKKCKELDFWRNCCMQSVKSGAWGNYELEPESGCPEGFRADRLICPGSYTWCMPIK